MNNLFNTLLDFKNWMKVVLIPRTLVQIILHPSWVRPYISEQIYAENNPPDDEYVNPIFLFLVVSIIPALALNLLSSYGVTISVPALEQTTPDRVLSINTRTDFISVSPEMAVNHVWKVKKLLADGSLEDIYQETHSSINNPIYTGKIDSNTYIDQLLYAFDEPGEYYVTVSVEMIDSMRNSTPVVEKYGASLRIVAPLEEQLAISNSYTNDLINVFESQRLRIAIPKIQSSDILFFVLPLLFSPLLFALATRLIVRRTFDYIPLGGNSLRESFFVQCYYNAPLNLAIWASYFALYFYTDDVFFYSRFSLSKLILLMPLVLCVLWIFRAQVYYFTFEKQTTPLRAILLAFFCVGILGAEAYFILNFRELQNEFRIMTLRLFPIAAVILAVTYGLDWFRRRRRNR